MPKRDIQSIGGARGLILECMLEIKAGSLDVEKGNAIISGLNALSKSIQVEINAAKMSLMATSAGKDFGDIMRLGQRPIFEGGLIEAGSLE